MQFSKSTVLPMLGMLVLALFIWLSYTHGAIFLDRILICSLIVSVIAIAKIRENTSKSVSNRNQGDYRNLSK